VAAFLFAHFEAVFLFVLALFIVGGLVTWHGFRPVLMGLAVFLGLLGLVSVIGVLAMDGFFGRVIASGPFSPIGWFFLSAGMVLFVLSWARDE